MTVVRPLPEVLRSRAWEDRQHRQLRELAAITIDRQEARIEALERENAELREALGPFETAGRIIDGPFGPALFAEDDMAFQSGCAWSENGERRTITWGDFRRARAALRDAKERKE